MNRVKLLAFLSTVALFSGCTDSGAVPADDHGTSSDGSGSTTTGTTTVAATDESSDGTTGDSEGSSEDTCNFVCATTGEPTPECDVWAQDCGDGQKCAPYSNNGEPTWNASRCVDVAEQPGRAGDPCTDMGGTPSGEDTCDRSHMCWNVDPETNQGTCIAFCSGSPETPVCDDPSTSCSITNEGFLILCLPKCDPLLQDCSEGEACYPVPGEQYACAPDITDGAGVFPEPCSALNGCAPGFFCDAAEVIPGCTEDACCNAFCDQEGVNDCPGADQQCVALFENPPPGFETVGRCALPSG